MLEENLNDKSNENLEMKERFDENIVSELMVRVEAVTTPTKRGTKKRRRVKQNVTPSPVHNQVSG